MTDNQENKLRMYYTVSAVCDNNVGLWQDNEVFVSDYQKFKQKIPKIKRQCDRIEIENILVQTFKSFDRVELEEMAYYLSGKLKLITKQPGSQTLFAQISNGRDSISTASHSELFSICNMLIDHASAYLNQLIPHGITMENITTLQQLTSTFFVNMKKLNSSHIKNKSSEEQLRKLFREADDTLRNRLDNDIEFYKNSDFEFYSQYQAARIIFDYKPYHKTIQTMPLLQN